MSDMVNMDTIFELAFGVIKLVIAGVIFLVGIKMMQAKKSNSMKTRVLQLQALLSKARMSLRAKVKKKSNVFRATVKSAILEGDVIDRSLKALTEIAFETSQDFQNYFDVSRQIVSLMHTDARNHSPETAPGKLENDFMCIDFKTELEIIRIIKEMATLSKKINEAVDENNAKNPSQFIEKVDSLVFPSMIDVNRIFKEDLASQQSAKETEQSKDSQDNSQKKAS